MKKKVLLGFVIIVGFLVYFPSLSNGFVWDDEEQIVNNQTVQSLKNLPSLFTGSTFNTGGTGALSGVYYRPLMMVVFSLIHLFFGLRPFYFHLIQLIVHLVNGGLIFLLFINFFPLALTAFLSLTFIIHPINSEAVSYISATQEVIYVFFGLLMVLAILKINNINYSAIVAAMLLFFSVLSKEVGVIFFLIGLIIARQKKQPVFLYLSFFSVVVIVYLFLRLIVAGVWFTPFLSAPIVNTAFSQRLIMLPAIFSYYLKTFFVPNQLSVMQHWVIKEPSYPGFYQPLLFTGVFFGLLFVVGFLAKTKTNRIVFLFFTSLFLISILPYMQLFPLDMTVADRWFYFPMIGLLGALGQAAIIIYSRINSITIAKKYTTSTYGYLFGFLGVLIIMLLSIRTVRRNADWRNGLTLFNHDIQISKNAFDLENNLGVELFRAGRIEDARIHFKRSIDLAPRWCINWNNLGAVYEKTNDLNRAETYYQKAINNGNYYLAYENYARLLIKQKKYQQAYDFIKNKGLRIFPFNQKLRQYEQYLVSLKIPLD